MEKLKLILTRFWAHLRAWWYNVSSQPIEAKYGALLFHLVALIAASLILLGLSGCSTVKYFPVEKETIEKIVVKDSLVYRDSIVYVPTERIVEVVPEMDTLYMETQLASSKAYLDTTLKALKGELKNKQAFETKYVERIEYVERTDTVYVSLPEPYPVEKAVTPKWAWYSLIFNIIVMLVTAFKIYLKLKP